MAPASAMASPMFFQWLPGGVSLPAAVPCQLQIRPSWMTVCPGCRLPRHPRPAAALGDALDLALQLLAQRAFVDAAGEVGVVVIRVAAGLTHHPACAGYHGPMLPLRSTSRPQNQKRQRPGRSSGAGPAVGEVAQLDRALAIGASAVPEFGPFGIGCTCGSPRTVRCRRAGSAGQRCQRGGGVVLPSMVVSMLSVGCDTAPSALTARTRARYSPA